MSDFGLFEAELDASTAPERVKRQASTKLANAIDEVRDRYGDFLLASTGKDEFEDRWHYAKDDIRKTAEAHVFPNTGTMRRIHDALKRELVACDCDHDDDKKDKDHNDTSDQGGGYTARRRTAEDFHGDLIPEDNFDGYLDSVDQGAPEKVENADFGQGGDTGSDRGREARRVALELYSDWAEGNGMKVAKLATLEHYADTGISDSTYHLLANYILASDEEGGCDTDTDGPAGPDKDSDGPAHKSESDSDSDSGDDDSDEDDSDRSDDSSDSSDEGGDSASSDDSGDDSDGGDAPAPDFGGDETGDGDPAAGDDQGFAGPPEGPQDLDDASADDGGDPTAPDAGGDPAAAGGDGMYPDAAGPGDQFAIPDAPPELSPDEQGMIPADDTQGDQSIPPELIDDILGLPPGTIEQLVVQEISGGGAAPDDGSGAPPPPPPPGGDDPSARLARQLFAEFTGKDWHSKSPKGESADKPKTSWDDTNGGVTKGKNPITPKASRRRTAEDDGGADSTQDPAAGGQVMSPPQGATPAASPTQPGPDDGAALDQAAQAVTQLIDQKTQQYQQLIDPLQQAAQAIQQALEIEQAANPLDVTPPAGTVDVGPGAQQPEAAPNTAQQTTALRRHAFKIAVRHDLSERGYHMLLAAMSNQHYRHVAEAIAPLRDPQEKMALAASLVDMFKADNVRFNPGAFLASAGIAPQHMASSPRDRAGDGWKDSRDRGDAEHEDHDTDPDNWEEREAARLGLVASRHPFAEGARRTAGETATPATGGNTMDVFEFPGQGKTPKFTDNNKLTDLPAMKGPKIGNSVVDKYQHYKDQQSKAGLPTGGETGVDGFFKSPAGKSYGNPSQTKVHEVEGLQPHKMASFFQPKVAGWNWDDHQNAYMTDGQKPFRCTTAGCDTDIPTPSQTMCRCGRLWYTYGIGDSNHLASNTGQLFLAREIPVRPDVIMANRQFTAAEEEFNNESGDGPYQDYAEDVEFFNDDELDTAPKAHAPGETDMDTTRSAGRRTATEYPDDHNVVTRDGEKFCSACDAMLWDPNVHHCPEKQASRRTADWTVYDDDDNAGYTEGPSGPPSTKVNPVRKDWAKVDGKGRFAPNTFK